MGMNLRRKSDKGPVAWGMQSIFFNLCMHQLGNRILLIYGPFPVVIGLAGYCRNEDIFELANLAE